MGAISGLFGTAGGNSGTGYETPSGTNTGQISTSYGQNQTALQQQQALLNALQQQQGLTNQSNVYNQLQGVVNGTGPNPAQAQLAQATGANVQNQAALQAGQRGAAGNVGLMARQAAQTGAATQQQAAGQAATLQAQQSLNALGAAGNLANTEASQQIAGTNAVTGANQAEQSILQGANTANNSVTGQLANTTMQGQQSIVGGVMQGIGGALSSLAKGGIVPKKYDDGGDVSTGDADADKGDTPTAEFQDTAEPATPSFGQDAGAAALAAGAKSVTGGSSGGGGGSSGGGGGMGSMIGMAAMAAAKGGRVPYDTGGGVQATPPAQTPMPWAVQAPNPYVAATDPNAPKSKFGKFMKQQQSSPGGGTSAQALQQGSSAMTQGIISALSSKKQDPNANLAQAQAQAAQMEQGSAIGNNDQYAGSDPSTPADESAIDPNDPTQTIAQGDTEYAAHGGNVGSKLKKGGHVPGKPKVAGPKNSYKNDTVKALLSPGEIVVPRSVTQGKDPVKDSARFVAAVLAKEKVNDNMKMDFSKFKKVAEDEKTATLVHPQGHKITIAKSGLEKDMAKKLSALPIHKDKVQHLDAGGTAGGETPDEAYPTSILDEFSKTMKAKADEAAAAKEQQDLQNYANAPAGNDADALNAYANGPDQSAPVAQAPVPTAAPAPSQAVGPIVQPQVDPMAATYQQQIKGLQEQAKGQQQVQQAMGAQGAANATSEQQNQDDQNDLFNRFNAENDDLTTERNFLKDDIASQKINPNEYLENMSTGKHILTGLGLIIGGMGSGLTHQPNLAAQFLQSQINHDIDAQKANLGKSQNLLSYNLQETHNLRAATDLTRMHTNDILASQLRMSADKSANPVAKGNILQIAGQLDQQTAQLQRQVALNKALMGQRDDADPESAFRNRMLFLRMNGQEALAKDMESKHVPGVGQASVPVDDKTRESLTKFNDVGSLIDKAIGLQQQFGVTGAWSPKARADANAIKNELTVNLNDLSGLNRLNEQEYKNYNSQVGNIGGVNLGGTLEGLKNMKQELQMKRSNELRKVGLQQQGAPASQAQPQYKTVNGVTYMRGPDGKAIRVK